MELLDDDGRPVSPGETGSVVVTTLANRAMPLIRYSGLADLASFGAQGCACGAYLEYIEGRKIEALVVSNGEKVNPYVVDAILADVQGIAQYQAIQHTPHDLEIVFVPDRSHPDLLPDWEPVLRQLGEFSGRRPGFASRRWRQFHGERGAIRRRSSSPVCVTFRGAALPSDAG